MEGKQVRRVVLRIPGEPPVFMPEDLATVWISIPTADGEIQVTLAMLIQWAKETDKLDLPLI